MSGTPGHSAGRTVLIAGAAGYLGRAAVAEFAANGWSVRGLVRDEHRASAVRDAGGTAFVADLLDANAVRTAAAGCAAVVHLAANASVSEAAPDAARRVRVEGARNLRAACRAAGVGRFVVGSGYWVYADQEGTFDEDGRLDPRGESAVNFDTERAALETEGPGGPSVMIVRPGMVYGAGSWFAGVLEAIRAGSYATIEGGRNPWSFVSLGDAAAGFRAIAERGTAGAVYNLVDLAPAPWGEFARHVAQRLGVAPPRELSQAEAVREYGEVIAHHLAARRAASSARLRALGWAPRYPTYRPGIDALLRSMGFADAP